MRLSPLSPRSEAAARRPQRAPRRIALSLLFLIVLLCALPVASAHAALVGAEPERNSELDAAPAELVLHFSEPFEERYTRVTVVDDADTRYDRDNFFESGNTAIRVPLDPMPDGVYTVHWRTLGTDTHVLEGRYLLAINVTFDDIVIPPGQASLGEVPDGAPGEIAVRTIGFLAGSLAAGISLFVLVLPRGDPLDAARRVHHRVTAVSGLVATLASFLLLVVIARRIDGSFLEAVGTQSGGWIVVRGLAFALAATTAAMTARWPGKVRHDDLFTAFFGLGGLMATTMSGHAASEATLRGLAIAVQFLHLVAVAFWLGGVLLLAVLVGRKVEASVLYTAVKRFSPLAVLAVAVIILTGSAASGLRILAPRDLLETVYGRALLLKILLLLPLIGLGAINRYVVQPRLAASEPTRAARHLRRTIMVEVAIMVVMLVAAGTLTTVAPPDTLAYDTGEGGRLDRLIGVVTTFETGGFQFTLRALPDPLTVGRQNITLEVERVEETDSELRTAFLVVRAPDVGPDGEGEFHRFTRIDDQTWYLEGFIMNTQGVWHNDVLVQGRNIGGTGQGAYERHTPMIVE